jgi:hypothetical protein
MKPRAVSIIISKMIRLFSMDSDELVAITINDSSMRLRPRQWKGAQS